MLPRNNKEAADEVMRLYTEIKQNRDPVFNRMGTARDMYNGDIAIPLPELDKSERPAVANLVMLGIDQTAMRVASVTPTISFPVLGNTGIAGDRAADSRRAVLGWWDMNAWKMLTRRRARHLIAYGVTIVSISPVSDDSNECRDIPHWRVRNPLATFPAPMTNPDSMEPTYCIFKDKHTMSWLEKRYPSAAMAIGRGSPAANQMVEVLEYVDDCETVLVAVGSERHETDMFGRELGSGVPTATLLERVPNRTGIVPVVIAGRVTLDRNQGQFDQVYGMYMREAKLDALNTIAIQRNVFADEWAQSSSNSASSPRIIKRANGRLGEIGIIDKGVLNTSRPPMNQEILQALDRYERNIRVSGGVPAEYGGESASNQRTARRAAEVFSGAVDMSLQESQEILELSSESEIRIGINMMKCYWGDKPSMFLFGKDGKVSHNDYVPNDTFVTDLAHVIYPLPGTDAASLTVQLGQMSGIGELSLATMRELDPRIDDPEKEKRRVDSEAIEKSFLTGIEQKFAQGTGDLIVLAKAKKKFDTGMDIFDAFLEVEKEMQEQQQAQAEAAAAGQPPTSEAQPGIEANPNQAPAPVPGAGGKPDLATLLAGLGGPANAQQNAVSQAPAPAPAGV